ncbi:MAG: cell wall hydrolase [Devosia sp.]|nr:cell wall hydrolase [Devosia sp.]
MAPPFRTTRANRAHAELVLLRALAGAAFTLFSYAAFTTGAIGPAHGSIADVAASPRAGLSQTGGDIVITGAIDHMFLTGSFAGPNRAEKQDRARPLPDVMVVASGFDAIRARLAALRAPKSAATAAAAPGPGASIAVASLAPDLASSALDAIDDAAAPGSGAPVPKSLSQQIAYAREDAPVTVFDGTVKGKDGKKVSAKELNCMATAIYFESRGESYRGQVAVGQVVMNRIAHKLYPGTICAVVYQNQHKRNACQFSFACDGIPDRVYDKKAWVQAEEIARKVVAGDLYLTEVGYATHYHATYVSPRWAPRMHKVTKVGLHVFYQFKRGWKFG